MVYIDPEEKKRLMEIEKSGNAGQSVKPKTFKEKMSNFWFYYRWQTAILIFVIAFTAVGIHSCVARPVPDVDILMVTNAFVPEEKLKLLEKKLAEFIEDYNFNGKTEVGISFINLAPGDHQMQVTMEQKFMAEIITGKGVIFIADSVGAGKLISNEAVAYIGDIMPDKQAFDGRALLIDINALMGEDFIGEIETSFYVLMKNVSESSLEDDNKKLKQERAIELIRKIVE